MSNKIAKLAAALSLSLIASGVQATCNVDFSGGSRSTPTSRFNDHGDGTVTDNGTGLMWMKCAAGKGGSNCVLNVDYTDNSVANPLPDTGPRKLSWQGALSYAKQVNTLDRFKSNVDINPGGHPDWRLPDAKELASLVERCAFNPSINTEVFTSNIPTSSNSGKYWSATPTYQKQSSQLPAELPLSAVVIDFHSGNDWREAKSSALYVRLVRNAN